MKYLSIFENEYECKEFLYQNGFISEDELNDDEYDLLKWFEGDPDWVDIKQPDGHYYRVYFAEFHEDNKYDGDSVCFHSGEDLYERGEVQSFLERTKDYYPLNVQTWEAFEQENKASVKVAYRGGEGYIYNLYIAE